MALADVVELELALLRPEVRRDPRRVGELLDDGFEEIGASGRIWSREETLAALASEHGSDPVDVDGMRAVEIAPGVVLLTYRSERAGVVARRSSIWRRVGGRWRLLHHQGTVVS